MTKAAAGVITHEAYRRTSPLFWRHTTSTEHPRLSCRRGCFVSTVSLGAGCPSTCVAVSLSFRQTMESCYGDVPLDVGIRSRRIDGVNGLSMHVLEAGYRPPDRPLVLLLHGFPELAFSWRKLMPLIAARGYHVVAPDQRGYGATTGWDADYDGELASFRLSNLVRDILALLAALQHQRVAAIVGHDFGSPVAAMCA